MSNIEIPFFDCLTGEEAAAAAAVMAALRDAPWAQPLLRNLPDPAALTHEHKAALFELRFGNSLHRAGIAPRYEVAGEGNSTVDFGLVHAGQQWLVELMRLEETEGARDATRGRVDEDGIEWQERILTTGAGEGRRSPEGETLKAVQRICQKCARGEQPHKFPVPGNAYHSLLVDFRTFANGGDLHDRVHVALGGEFVPPEVRHVWNGKPISGAFSARTIVRGAAHLRERVHFIGFVNEREFGPGAFAAATEFIANPALFANGRAAREALATWPLQPARLLNGAD
jgi:hypothetical protein